VSVALTLKEVSTPDYIHGLRSSLTGETIPAGEAGPAGYLSAGVEPPVMFRTVLIATDGSESAERAVDAGLDLAERFDATVHALSVVDEDDTDGEERRLREALADLAARADRPVVTAVRRGTPADRILGYAGEADADVVVVGTRGRHGPGKFHLGSVAEAVVRRSPTPVLTVRDLD
jgi:nucleotide-binding universal stress UspA family protein